ncbi:pentapeptide repeat-containing protein [Streptomyces sp. IB2014 016-6]|uniref:pentapeptide repeat-containing protein n=1 Tax=Streptomyces sp. IB2014 016-6 TaxID=2517818 RepID=UPI0011C9EA1A|nr:pentapeptide repeat-containing protein [Streptomyces sp. IB2014 016-6]TXL87755.1 pentapeptide repeat-containing protein [Streptomyces sp. IB2014 016-6]
MNGWKRRTLLAGALVVVVLGYGWLMWQGPWLFDGAHLRDTDLQPADGVVITGFRTSLVALGAGAIAGVGLFYTHRSMLHTRDMLDHTRTKDREQAHLTREGQVTERYVEAIKLLSGDHLTQRLGGIYSLERIMRDSEKDRATVVEVLAAFVRTNAPANELPQTSEAEGEPSLALGTPAEDIRAVLAVLKRRNITAILNLTRTDLRATNLRDANLQGAHLQDVTLRGAHLQRANLRLANLEGADLPEAHLEDAHLQRANLQDANLEDTDLQRANLQDANLPEVEIVATARLYRSTGLPPEVAGRELIIARIEECEQEDTLPT